LKSMVIEWFSVVGYLFSIVRCPLSVICFRLHS
jgi:hypothetical protein